MGLCTQALKGHRQGLDEQRQQCQLDALGVGGGTHVLTSPQRRRLRGLRVAWVACCGLLVEYNVEYNAAGRPRSSTANKPGTIATCPCHRPATTSHTPHPTPRTAPHTLHLHPHPGVVTKHDVHSKQAVPRHL